MLFARDKGAVTPADRPVGNIAAENSVQDALGRLDDAQVVEVVTNAYWRLFEQFFAFDEAKTDLPSVVNAS